MYSYDRRRSSSSSSSKVGDISSLSSDSFAARDPSPAPSHQALQQQHQALQKSQQPQRDASKLLSQQSTFQLTALGSSKPPVAVAKASNGVAASSNGLSTPQPSPQPADVAVASTLVSKKPLIDTSSLSSDSLAQPSEPNGEQKYAPARSVTPPADGTLLASSQPPTTVQQSEHSAFTSVQTPAALSTSDVADNAVKLPPPTPRVQILTDGLLTLTAYSQGKPAGDTAIAKPPNYQQLLNRALWWRIALVPQLTDQQQPPDAYLQCFTLRPEYNQNVAPLYNTCLQHRISVAASPSKLTLQVKHGTVDDWTFKMAEVDELEQFSIGFKTANSLKFQDSAAIDDLDHLASPSPQPPMSAASSSKAPTASTPPSKMEDKMRAEQRYMRSVKNRMYQKMFNLPSTEELIEDYSCAIKRAILLHGRMYVSANYVCFYSSIFSHKTSIIIRIADILHVQAASVALVFDNSVKIFVQTGELPMHTHTAISRKKSADDAATHSDSESEPTSTASSAATTPTHSRVGSAPEALGSTSSEPPSPMSQSMSLNTFAARTHGRADSETENPLDTSGTDTALYNDDTQVPEVVSAPNDVTVSTATLTSPLSAPVTSSVDATPPAATTDDKLDVPPSADTAHSPNSASAAPMKAPSLPSTVYGNTAMLSLPLIDLLENGHPSIAAHFFASFLTRDHALRLIESLVNAKQRAYYDQHGYMIRATSEHAQTQLQPTSAKLIPSASTDTLHNPSSSPTPSTASTQSNAAITLPSSTSSANLNQSVTTPIPPSISLPSLALPSFESVTVAAPVPATTIAAVTARASSPVGDITSLSSADVKADDVQSTPAAPTTDATAFTATITITNEAASSSPLASIDRSTITLESQAVPYLPIQADPIDMATYRPPDVDIDTPDTEWEEVLDVTLPISAHLLWWLCFADDAIFSQNSFQSLKGDYELKSSAWQPVATADAASTSARDVSFRQILTNPMAPPNTRVYKTQKCLRSSKTAWETFHITSRCITPDVPIAGDCVMVCDKIAIDNIVGSSAYGQCRVRVALGICFLRKPFKIRPLISTIKGQTKKDIKGVWDLWQQQVNKVIEQNDAVIKATAERTRAAETDMQAQQAVATETSTQPSSTQVAPTTAATTAQATPPPKGPDAFKDPVSELTDGVVTLPYIAFGLAALALLLHTMLSYMRLTSSAITQLLLATSVLLLLFLIHQHTSQLHQTIHSLQHRTAQQDQQLKALTTQLQTVHDLVASTKLIVRVEDDYVKK